MCESLTNDPFILDTIKHHHIEFEDEYPIQSFRPKKAYFSPSEITIIDEEVAKVLSKGVLTKVKHTADGFISNIFVRPKKDGTYRTILTQNHLMCLLITTILNWTHSAQPSSLFDLDALWRLLVLKTHTIQSP